MLKTTSSKITNMSIVCALFVAFAHVRWMPECGLAKSIHFILIVCIARITVPFFFVVSGYFIFRHSIEDGWYKHAVVRRFRTLLIPYIVWSLVYGIAMMCTTGRWSMGIGGWGVNLCTMPHLAPLWFIRALMLFVVVSPIVKWFVNVFGVGFLASLYILAIVESAIMITFDIPDESYLGCFLRHGFPVNGLLYFAIGMFLQQRKFNDKSKFFSTAIGIGALSLVMLCANTSADSILRFVDVRCAAMPFMLFALWNIMPSYELPKMFKNCAFPIYVMHAIVFNVIWSLFGVDGLGGSWFQLAYAIVLPIVTFNAMRCYCPRIAAVLFGGRI